MPRTKTSWRPGHSGNPKGRPRRGTALSDQLRARLSGLDGGKLIDVLIRLALKGNLAAIITCLDRLEGKPSQTLHVGGGEPRVVRMPIAGPPDDTVGVIPPEDI
jgi:hypothetical protein